MVPHKKFQSISTGEEPFYVFFFFFNGRESQIIFWNRTGKVTTEMRSTIHTKKVANLPFLPFLNDVLVSTQISLKGKRERILVFWFYFAVVMLIRKQWSHWHCTLEHHLTVYSDAPLHTGASLNSVQGWNVTVQWCAITVQWTVFTGHYTVTLHCTVDGQCAVMLHCTVMGSVPCSLDSVQWHSAAQWQTV